MKNILNYKDFYAKIYYEEETDTFWGELIDIEDVISFESDTIEGLKREFRNTVDEYLEECKVLNKNPYKHYKGSLNIRLKPEIHQKAVIFAKIDDISLNQFIGNCVESIIENREKQKI